MLYPVTEFPKFGIPRRQINGAKAKNQLELSRHRSYQPIREILELGIYSLGPFQESHSRLPSRALV